MTIEYDASNTLVQVAPGSANFFTNPFAAACGPINICSLKVAGCGSAYSATGNLVIDATSGAITAK
jgi:hypothetical protein